MPAPDFERIGPFVKGQVLILRDVDFGEDGQGIDAFTTELFRYCVANEMPPPLVVSLRGDQTVGVLDVKELMGHLVNKGVVMEASTELGGTAYMIVEG